MKVNLNISRQIISAFLLLLVSAEIVFGADKGSWIVDLKTDCRVWNPNPLPNETISWSGECSSGRAQGAGELIWFKNGIRTWSDLYSVYRGVLMKNGREEVVIDPRILKFQFDPINHSGKCPSYDTSNKYGGPRSIMLDVTDDIYKYLSSWTVTNYILDQGALFAQERCPMQNPVGNIQVRLIRKGQRIVIGSTKGKSTELKWTSVDNSVYRKKKQFEKKQTQIAKEEHRRIASKRKIELEKNELNRKREEANRRYNNFSVNNKVQEWPSIDTLAANPFIFEGKVVATPAIFMTMKSAKEGVFKKSGNVLLVEKIPSGTFRGANQSVVLAGKVLGKAEFRGGRSVDGQVPILEFVGVYLCKKNNCEDIIQH